MTSEIEESPGVTSSMRVLVRDVKRLSIFSVVSGVALAFAMIALDRGYSLMPVALFLCGGGLAAPPAVGAAKAAQANAESQGTVYAAPSYLDRPAPKG